MAVAVKNTPEIASHGLLDRLAVASLAGTVYAIGWIGIVFYLVPNLWWRAFPRDSAVAWSFLILIDLAVAVGLTLLGARLLGPKAPHGVRAGICAGLIGVVLVLLLSRWASLWFEHWVYDTGWFGVSVGAVLSAAVLVLLLAGLVRLFFHPKFEQFLLTVADQGWFRAQAYKANQGQKVRRGTVLGLLLIAGAGVYTLLNHGTLKRAPADWALNVPFTTEITVEYPGDVGEHLPAPPGSGKPVVSRAELDRINREFADPGAWMKIYLPGNTDWKVGQLVKRSEFDEKVKELSASGLDVPVGIPPQGASGPATASRVVLLPGLQFTVPLLLLALSLWLSWRVVNLPVFADFLIATEAELNKVSWTTQRRLLQDTVVVLVTVLLMAIYLFAMDQGWRVVLSWKPIGVLQMPEEKSGANTKVEQRDW
jgi:preprotein translocase SecE subunit